ncbi:MAG: cation-translocating P-type ATPase [Clostridia bacterium]|nr:cation-translocating P-type ATPase [Clostridia bacterium]
MKKIILSIDGMTCSACSNGLEKYLNKQNGIISASVNLVMANATVEYNEKVLTIAQIEEFVKQAGFKSLGEFKEIKFEEKNKKEKIEFIILTILAIVLMYISMGHMINLPMPSIFDPHANSSIYMFTLLILTVCFIVYGFDILKNGYKNLIHRTPNMDTLVGIGVITSLIYSIYNMYKVFAGDHLQVMNLYFESAAIVIYFIKLGRHIDKLSKDKTKEAIQKLVKITPNKAVIKVDGVEKEVTLDEISKGDIVVSRAGEKIAVDGEILEGTAHVDETFITGESKPVSKEKGSKVIAGSMNYDGYLEYKAEKIGRESTVSEIVKLVLEASNTKAPIAKIADKVSGYFVPVVIVIAILTFIGYLIIGSGIQTAISAFVTVLVVACPCSLGLATPLAIVVSEGLCASNRYSHKKE